MRTNRSAMKASRVLIPCALAFAFALSGVSGAAFALSQQSAHEPALLAASPVQIPSNPGPDYYHWYAGGVYTGTSGTATQVNSNVTVPGGAPPTKNQFYYVILSIWDNTGSYDQIGFTNDNGIWGLAYSYTTGLNGTTCSGTLSYHYKADAKTLTAGATYDFFITIKSGTVYFTVYSSGSEIFSLKTKNGATSFSVSETFCGYYNYTVYEEAYMNTATAVPNHNFDFSKNQFGPGGNLPTWTPFTISSPAKVHVKVSGTDDSKADIIN